MLAGILFLPALAQKISIPEYIDQYKELAIEEMRRTGVPASIKLAQGIHETESGNSDLVKRSNNHFGIKCKTGWSGEFVYHDDDALGECFRKYPSAEESYRDHSNFLRRSNRYAFLFNLDPTDYKNWAYGLKKAGYATNPKYPALIIKYIEQYNLQEYTLIALRKNNEPEQNNGLAADSLQSDPASGIAGAPAEPAEPALEDRVTETSRGKTLFNGLRAVWAKSGTSLLAIASEHNIPLSRLLEYNDLEHDGLLTHDEWIYLEKKRKTGQADAYVNPADETPRFIAQLNAIQLNYLLQYNGFEKSALVPAGTKVRLKPADKTTASMETPAQGIVHEVKPKEGLYAISRKYQVSVDSIRTVNKLESDQLKIGQKLIIAK